MSQIAVFCSSLGVFDLGYEDGTLALTEDLSTAIALSLLTDKRAAPGQIPAGNPRGGWWGDTYATGNGFGSWLWTLAGRARDEATLALAVGYAKEACGWLLEDGIADRIEAEAAYSGELLRVRIGISHGSSLRWSQWWARTL
jgi:phage gp46-like protein